MRRLTAMLVALGAVLWLVVPAFSLWWLTRTAADTSLTPAATTYVPVQRNVDPTVMDVDVVVVRAPVPQLIAPSLSGLIEDVSIASGDTIGDGMPVLVSDGITRLAYASERPFGRPLTWGNSGSDVVTLNTLLDTLGFEHGSAEVIAASTITGIRAMARSIGAGATDTFDPGWVVFLPAPSIVVTNVDLTLGAPVLAPGEVLATGQAGLLSATLVPTGTVVAPAPSDPSGPASPDAGAGPVVIDADTPRAVAPPGAVLSVDGVPIPLDDTRSAVSPEGLAALDTVLSADDVVAAGKVTTPPAEDQYVVPPAALFADGDGQSCVLRRRDGTDAGIVVQTAGSFYDRIVITGDVKDGDELALSPPAEQRACG